MYFVSISNGIFEPKHRQKIGIALWEFEWLIDRVTKIDGNNFGIVLGGKPIRLKEISKVLGISRRQTERNIKKLEKDKYITIKRAPYGLIIKVNKCQKRFGRNAISSYATNGISGYATNGISLRTSVASNKTVQLDNTNYKSVATQRPYKKFMKNYDENQYKDDLPSINADTGELEKEAKKPNLNERWQKFRAFWEAAVLKDRGFRPETGLKDKVAFHAADKKFKTAELEKIVFFFLKDKKSKEHLSVTACFSTDTINNWKQS